MYEKAMAPESRNGGTSSFNNNGTNTKKRKLLIVLDIFCLLLGESYRVTTLAEKAFIDVNREI